ncbi:MAG: hypothetical protein JWN86_1383 [Planctomycetota bacterium]|nr:hypothetical protein [Planctomycetota bacterium]
MSELLDRINDIRMTCRPRCTFSLERGKGETYWHSRPVLYVHSVYDRSSVLAGQPRRLFVEQWETWEHARAALSELRKKDRTFKYDDYGEGGGTSHIPSSVLTRHLPNDEG